MKRFTILALQIEARQIAFAVFQNRKLIGWGSKSISSAPIAQRVHRLALPAFRELVERYQPDVVVFPEATNNLTTVRSRFLRVFHFGLFQRVRPIRRVSRHEVHETFKPLVRGNRPNKDRIMQALTNWFPSLRVIVPAHRRLWQSQHHRVALFDAIALGVTHLLKHGDK